jgi:hypothetical protein
LKFFDLLKRRGYKSSSALELEALNAANRASEIRQRLVAAKSRLAELQESIPGLEHEVAVGIIRDYDASPKLDKAHTAIRKAETEIRTLERSLEIIRADQARLEAEAVTAGRREAVEAADFARRRVIARLKDDLLPAVEEMLLLNDEAVALGCEPIDVGPFARLQDSAGRTQPNPLSLWAAQIEGAAARNADAERRRAGAMERRQAWGVEILAWVDGYGVGETIVLEPETAASWVAQGLARWITPSAENGALEARLRARIEKIKADSNTGRSLAPHLSQTPWASEGAQGGYVDRVNITSETGWGK